MKAIKPYRWDAGMISWFLHRITGIGLVFYLPLHLYVIHHFSQGKVQFEAALKVVTSPFFLLLEIGLFATILFHAFNGVRILLFDAGVGIKSQKGLFVFCLLLIISLLLIGAIPFLNHFMHAVQEGGFYVF